jgi:hypothetical protein
LPHEGDPIGKEAKWILRSDVMYNLEVSPLSSEQIKAYDISRQAQSQEENGNRDVAISLYRQAYKLWPQLQRV